MPRKGGRDGVDAGDITKHRGISLPVSTLKAVQNNNSNLQSSHSSGVLVVLDEKTVVVGGGWLVVVDDDPAPTFTAGPPPPTPLHGTSFNSSYRFLSLGLSRRGWRSRLRVKKMDSSHQEVNNCHRSQQTPWHTDKVWQFQSMNFFSHIVKNGIAYEFQFIFKGLCTTKMPRRSPATTPLLLSPTWLPKASCRQNPWRIGGWMWS